MPLLALALLLFLPLLMVLLMPVALVQRYRVGTMRRKARGCAATLNTVTFAFSAAVFLLAAALTSLWVPEAFRYALAGVAAGAVLGIIGLSLTRWEQTPQELHFTPNKWLVLALTAAVAGRLLYGLWRAWHAWGITDSRAEWLAQSGVAGSLAVGAVVIGYYLSYSAGVSRRVKRHRIGAFPR